MNRFFNYYTSLCSGSNTYNVFSYDPYIIAMKKMLVSELQKVVFYIEKLKNLNIDMSSYTDKVIDFISVIIINLDFKKESFFTIVQDLYTNRKILEKIYIDICNNEKLDCSLLDLPDNDLSSKEVIIKILNEYEQNIKHDGYKYDKYKNHLFDVILNLLLNACNVLIELKNFNYDAPQIKDKVLELLNRSNSYHFNQDELISIIKDFSASNYQIMKILYEKYTEKYGSVIKKKVPLNHKEGKAILVSDTNYFDLEKLLISLKNYDINVYTHQNMIEVFKYENFSEYSNLYGSFKSSKNNIFLDFASFPGPIFVSRNAVLKTDVIRGQIYTCAKYPAYGIGKIENDDFSPIINYALESKGFEKNSESSYKQIGYSDSEVNDVLSQIIQKYNNKQIKHIHIIGLIDAFNNDNQYIKDFLKSVPEDDFIISFAYQEQRDNFFFANSFFDFSLLYKIIEILFRENDEIKSKMGVFILDCSPNVISHIFNLIHLQVKNLFIGPCCPNIMSPDLIKSLSTLFNINSITLPLDDIYKYK